MATRHAATYSGPPATHNVFRARNLSLDTEVHLFSGDERRGEWREYLAG